MGGEGQAVLSLRSYPWGAILVVVANGRIDATNVHRLDGYLSKLQGEHDLIVDLVDVMDMDRAGARVVTEAAKRAERSGWGFAIVTQPGGRVAEAIRSYRLGARVRMLSTRQAARTAMQTAR